MKKIKFEDLVVGRVYYDVDNPCVVPAKFKLIRKDEYTGFFIGLENCSCYDPSDNGIYKFTFCYFYSADFKFGR